MVNISNLNMIKFSRFLLAFIIISAIGQNSIAQVNSVTFGKNRLQYKKFKWQYYQSENFNVYFNEGGQELAKYVLQVAEKELPQIETATEYSLQRRANIILYNHYADMKQTNIGLETISFNTGGFTKLVNNKMVIYFDANHYNLRRQVRQGIADVITKNLLFGDDIGEIAGNQNLLDLPKWLTDGYVAYIGENWSTDLDDDLRSEVLSGNYSRFSSFAHNRPLLAGHAFWYFIEEKYKKENVTYLLYLMRTYKSVNKASVQVTKKKFKDLLVEFMEYSDDKYGNDVFRRKQYPKGSIVEGFDINKRLNYYRINANPNKKDNSYVLTRFKKGIVSVIYNDGYDDKTLLRYGIRTYEEEMNPNYPMMAWDPKGTRIAVLYAQEGRLKMFVYDLMHNYKSEKLDLTDKFDQVQDIKFMFNDRTFLVSAVKDGHTDIYTYNIDKDKVQKITNDVYDDLDASFVAFPGKTGILFASNRPNAYAKGGDTSIPSNQRYNVFMITDFGDKPELNQITQLTNLKYGNARFPMQYNNNHFTFVSDENGIGNRYAGFFTSTKLGLDTLVLIGDDILRNPSQSLIDSTLRANSKSQPDSVAVVSVTSDSAYTFPLSNYPSSIAETRIAGDNNQVTEVTRQSDEKIVYKLKIDENTLRRRNISAPPTTYSKKLMRESERTKVDAAKAQNAGSEKAGQAPKKQEDNLFQNEFENTGDTAKAVSVGQPKPAETDDENVLTKAKVYPYKPLKFSADFGSAGVNSTLLINRYEPYMGGTGPIRLNSSTPLNGLVQIGASDLMEDIRINGAYKLGTNLKDNEWYVNFQNLKRRIDWGLSFYRNVQGVGFTDGTTNYPGKMKTNIYQGNISYPFDEARSVRLTSAIRSDRYVLSSIDWNSAQVESFKNLFSTNKLEYIYDNSQNVATNIWNGLRYKVYAEWNTQINKGQTANKPYTYNVGFDGRYYYPIFRNLIWAGRAAGDFSFGNQKICYFLGGVDGWLMFGPNIKLDKNGNQRYRYFNETNKPANDVEYMFQSLAVNMRGYVQNIASGNNYVVLNSEFRMPVWSTLFDRTVNNAFLNNLQIIQFTDFGTAWNGDITNIKRPVQSFTNTAGSVVVRKKAGGIGPFAGGYGFGVRSSLLGYFVKYDVSWPMSGIFKGRPQMYLALGLDF